MGAERYSCLIRLGPTYILPAEERRLLGKFQPDSFKTERIVCLETDGHTDRRACIYFMGSETTSSLRCKIMTEITKCNEIFK